MRQIKKNVGFTLLEIMLVLVLLSLSAAAVVIAVPGNRQDMAEEEARRFYHRLMLLNEDAILNGIDFGILFEPKRNKYTFLQLSLDGWQPVDNRRYKETVLDDSLTLSFELGDSAWSSNESLFEKTSLFDEDMFAELEDEKKQKPPQIFVLSSGEITPFKLSVQVSEHKRNQPFWRVTALESGVIELLAPGEKSKGESDNED